MTTRSRTLLAAAAITAAAAFGVACGGDEEVPGGNDASVDGGTGTDARVDAALPDGGDASVVEDATISQDATTGDGSVEPETNSLRIHYQPGAGQSVEDWSIHYFGSAVQSGPEWGQGPRFTATSTAGGYVDIAIHHRTESLMFFLTLFPAGGGDPIKDVETEVVFDRASPHPTFPNVREVWIAQGKPVSLTPPPAVPAVPYRVASAGDFIDLGDGRVRFMFRVNPSATGTVAVWQAADKSDEEVYPFDASAEINRKGLLVDLKEVNPDWQGKEFGYSIHTTVGTSTDATADLTLRPVAFTTATTSAAWARQSVMYQLMVRTFADGGKPIAVEDPATESGIDPSEKDGIGDLIGLRNKLAYLRTLGVDALWITPIFKASSFHNYDTLDYYEIDPAYGTLKDFRDLMRAAHCLEEDDSTTPNCTRINIILDFVQNHTANTTPWFVSSIDPSDAEHEKYANWFVWYDEYTDMFEHSHPWSPGDRLWHCRAFETDYRCYHKIFWSGTPELNLRNPEVRQAMKDITRFWVEDYGVDGFRLDASKHIDQFDDLHGIPIELHGTHVWWKEFNAFVKALRPESEYPVLLAGENRWDDVFARNRIVAGGIEAVSDVSAFDADASNWRVAAFANDMDSQFDFTYRSAVNRFLAGADYTAATFESPTLVQYLVDVAEGVAGSASRPNVNANPRHFFARFLSNHDVDRPASLLSGDSADVLQGKLRLAAATVLTVPGTPVIYYGEEYGKFGRNDGGDSFIREPMEWVKAVAFRHVDGRREIDPTGAGMQDMCVAINPSDPTIKFIENDDGVSVEEQLGVDGSLLSFYQQLIQLRRAHPIFTDAATTLSEEAVGNALYAFRLENETQEVSSVVVALNRSATESVLLPVSGVDLLTDEESSDFDVPPLGVRIIHEYTVD